MGSRTVTIHVGYPKMGSTFLQSELFAEHSQLADFGNENFTSEKSYDDLITETAHHICKKESLEFDQGRSERRIAATLKHVPAEKNVVVSHEGLCLPGRADRRLVVDRLTKLFDNCQILVVIRRREDLITSTCFQHLQYDSLFGEFDSINDWLDDPLKFAKHITAGEYDHPIRRLRFYPFLRFLKDHIGIDNMLVIPYEKLVADQPGYVRTIAEFADIDPVEAVELAGDREKVNERSKEEQLYLNSLFQNHSLMENAARISPEGLNQWVKRILQTRSEFDTELNAYWEDKISNLAAEDNEKIIDQFGLDLADYDYTVPS